MKLFAVAFGICCAVGLILFVAMFVILTVVGLEKAALPAATALGSPPIAAFTKMAELLERREGKKALIAGKKTPVYDFHGFHIAWPLMGIYGSLVLLVVSFLADSLVGVVAGAMAIASGIAAEHLDEYLASEPVVVLALCMDFLISIPIAYVVGSWIGTRCSQRGVLAVLLTIVLSFVIGLVVGALVAPTEMQAKWSDVNLVVSLVEFPVMTLVCLIGYWRGRRHQTSKYLHYLLGILPTETRETVVELACDEARKVASAVAARAS